MYKKNVFNFLSFLFILTILLLFMFNCKNNNSNTNSSNSEKAQIVDEVPTANELYFSANEMLKNKMYVPLQAYDNSIQKYRQLIILYPKHPLAKKAQYNIAKLTEEKIKYQNTGIIEKRKRMAVDEEDKSFQAIKKYLIDYSAAVEEYLKVSEKYPNTEIAFRSLKLAADLASDELNPKPEYDIAISCYKKIIDNYSNKGFSDVSFYKLGRIFEKHRDYDTAKKYYKKLIDDYKQSIFLTDAYNRWNKLNSSKSGN